MSLWMSATVGLVLTLALYLPHVQQGRFVYEDSKAAQAASSLTLRRPVASLAWRWASSPQAGHALSLGLHLVVAGLLGLLAWRLGYTVAGIGLVGLFAALHPMTVEATAYAAARSELLAAIGVLVALVCAAGRWWRPLPALGIVAGLLFGLLSKESAIVGLVLVPLVCWLRRETVQPPQQAWVYGLLVLWMGGLALWTVTGMDSLEGLLTLGSSAWWQAELSHLPGWMLAQSAAAGRLLWSSVTLQGFTVDADIDLIPFGVRVIAVYALLGLGWLAWHVRKTQPRVTFGLIWCLLAILPRLFVQTPRSYLNEHQFTLPFLGLILAGMAWWEYAQEQTA